MSGKPRSRMMMSGGCWAACEMPSCPVVASRVRYPFDSRQTRSKRRICISSSMIRAVGLSAGVSFIEDFVSHNRTEQHRREEGNVPMGQIGLIGAITLRLGYSCRAGLHCDWRRFGQRKSNGEHRSAAVFILSFYLSSLSADESFYNGET